MTDGTSQGLFIVVAIVIFGIFVVMAYILFEDTLSPALASMFNNATETATTRLKYTENYSINGDFSKFEKTNYFWDTNLNGEFTTNRENIGWSGGYNGGVLLPEYGYHAHLDFEKFGQPVMSFNNNNHLFSEQGVEYRRWLGINHRWGKDSKFMTELKEGSVVEVSFDLWSDKDTGFIYGGLFQPDYITGKNERIPGIIQERFYVSKKESWERVALSYTINDQLDKNNHLFIYLYGNGEDNHATKYIDNIEVRIVR